MHIELPTKDNGALLHKGAVADIDLSTPFKGYMGAIIRDAEEQYLVRMLRHYKGNINQIAKLMDVDRKTVYRKMSEYAIDPALSRETA